MTGDRHYRDKALDQIFRAIALELHLYVVPRVRESDVNDVLQETWKAIDTNIRTFKGRTDKEFLKWCYIIAMHKCADSHKHPRRMDAWPEEELTKLIDESSKAKAMSPEDRLDLEYAMNLLKQSKPECRELLWSHYVIGFDFVEIAEQFQLKYDAARQRVNRCLETVQDLI